MPKISKILLITALLLIVILNLGIKFCYATTINMDLEENNVNSNNTQANNTLTNTTKENNTLTTSSTPNTTSTSTTVTSIQAQNELTISDIINIILVSVGILLIFLAIAIIIKLK